jgi:hypothetical protein
MNDGGTQQTDRRRINRQSNPNGKEMSFDKNSCKFDKRSEPQPEVQYVPSPFLLPVPGMAPCGVPGTASEMVPEPISLPLFAGGLDGLEPVFVP